MTGSGVALDLAGAILTGGASTRMGRTKALVEVDGESMGNRVAAALRAVGADPVVFIGGDPQELRSLHGEVVADRHPGDGPLGGVATALHHACAARSPNGRRPRLVFVLACDLALIGTTTLQRLLTAARDDEQSQVWVAATHSDDPMAPERRIEPMCALWRCTSADDVDRSLDDGERALHAVIGRLRHTLVPVDRVELHNVNAPGDIPPGNAGGADSPG